MENLFSYSGLYKNVNYNADSISVNFSQVFLAEILMMRAKWILTTVIFL